LSDAGGKATGCSVDKKTGDLAVTNNQYNSAFGNVAVYVGASGTPTYYTDSNVAYPEFAGYDPRGNLFIDGSTAAGAFTLSEIPKGSTKFTELTIKAGSPSVPGQVQWAGHYLLVGDVAPGGSPPSAVYQMTIDKATATIKNTVTLTGTQAVVAGWKSGSTYAAPDLEATDDGYIFSFPGGKQKSTFPDASRAYGAVVVQKN
jgi:hypothetical protein